MTKGREVPELPIFTFANGKQVRTRKVSQGLVGEVRRLIPMPKPPVVEQEIMGVKRMAENPADPDYIHAIVARQEVVGKGVMRLAIQRGVELMVSDEVAKAELADALEALRGIVGPEAEFEEPDPKTAYILYICATDGDELTKLSERILQASMPTEEAIAEAISTFRPDVQGA